MIIIEFSGPTKLNPNFKDKRYRNLNTFKMIPVTKKVVDKYIDRFPNIYHCKPSDKTHKSFIWLDDNSIVGYLTVASSINDDNKWIATLLIEPEYRGHGLSKQILDVATKKIGANAVGTEYNNEIAKKIYIDYGFNHHEYSKDGKIILMYLK